MDHFMLISEGNPEIVSYSSEILISIFKLTTGVELFPMIARAAIRMKFFNIQPMPSLRLRSHDAGAF